MSYFQFKQFIINQDRSAMKVCTDACILGAWFAARIPSRSTVLDIGSGTGLLMLMLAQKSNGIIHGIELDAASFEQQEQNILQSKWSGRLYSFAGDARNYLFPVKYDFIISNPPFFENDLTSPIEEKNIAKHSRELNLEALLTIIEENLSPGGSFGILLPFHRIHHFEKLAESRQFFLFEKLLVRQTPAHEPFRGILQFSAQRADCAAYDLTIKNKGDQYSPEFKELLADYYLYL